MSKTIDEKVVEMRFDNSNFEKNIASTLKTLDQLKWKLQDHDLAGSSFKELNKAANNVDMSGLSRGIETVHSKFSALQVMGITALANLTNAAVNAGKRMASSLIDPLVNGGRERAQKIKDAKFQIEGLLGTEEYNKQWNRIDESINYAVRDTAYGYDSAARAASQFLASNVKVGEEMDTSLRAISGVAAMTNSTYDDISNIFTRVAGQGRVMANDLNSLASRGLNAAAQLGKSMGKTEEEIRDMVSEGKISFKQFATAMDSAFGEHAKKGNETFQGALANMKAAMSRIGAKVWDPLLDNQRDVFNQARLLINDLNNNYVNGPINSLNEKLTSIFKGIVKFFELGGVKNIVLGIGDALSFLGAVIKPIKSAFVEIFPPTTVETLVEYTKKFKNLTSQFKLSSKTAEAIKNTFKGLFSIVDIGVSAVTSLVKGLSRLISNLTGIPGGIAGVTGALGKWVTGVRDSVKSSGIFTNVVEGVVNVLEKFTGRMRDFISELDIFGLMVDGLKGVFSFIGKLGSEIGQFLGSIFKNGDIEAGFDLLEKVLQGGILYSILEFANQLKMLAQRSKELVGNISSPLYNIKEAISALQYSIKASAIMEIAKALLVLAVAIVLLGSVNSDILGKNLTALGTGLAGLIGALWLLNKFTLDFKGGIKLIALDSIISSLAFSLIKLSIALKILSTIDVEGIHIALGAMTVGLGELVGVLWLLPKDRELDGSIRAIRKLSTSLVIFAVALKIMSTIPWPNILWGLGAMTASLTLLSHVMRHMPTYSKDDKIPSMIKMTFSLVILAGALKLLSTMSWDDITRSLHAMGGTFVMLWAFVKFLPKDLKELNSKINALNMMALGLGFTALALMGLGTMNWDQINIALHGMGVSLGECLAFLWLLPKDVKSKTAGFIAFSTSLLILAGVLKVLGSLSLPSLGIALLAIAGAFGAMWLGAKLLGPVIPTLLGLAGAMALFGLGIGLFGAGVTLVATGIGALATALAGGVTAIVAGITAIILGVAGLVPQLIQIFGESVKSLCEVIMTCAPMIAETVLVVVDEILKSLANHGPSIVNSLFDFLIGVLQALKAKLPEFVVAGMELVDALGKGILQGLKNLNPDAVLPAVLAIGALTGIMIALSTLSGMIPSAMLGVLGFGVLIAELGLVLAAVGALSKIPGLNDLVYSGGEFLLLVGQAIGKFIGGLVGGVASGFSSSMPTIASNLSEFMKNITPFIEGAKNIDASVLGGIAALSAVIYLLSAANFVASLTEFMTLGLAFGSIGTQLSEFMNNAKDFISGAASIDPNTAKNIGILAGAILAITAANMINNMSNFMSIFTGGNSLEEFGSQLSKLGTGLKEFVDNLGTFGDDQIKTVECACNALTAISDVAKSLPNNGGLAALFAGDNDISSYAMKLPIFGMGISLFVKSLGNFGDEQVKAINCAGEAIVSLANAAKEIPNSGGLVTLFTGDNDISVFAMKLPIVGAGLSLFAKSLGSFGDEQIKAVTNGANAIGSLAKAANGIPNSGGLVTLFTGDNDISVFAMKLPIVGAGLALFAKSLEGFDEERMKLVKNGVDTIASLTKVANEIPNSGGLGVLFTGDNDISVFAAKLPIIGGGLALFGKSLAGFNEDQMKLVKNGAETISILSKVANEIPNSGGLGVLFTGDNDISSFASKLPIVGAGLALFGKSLAGFDEEQMKLVKNGAETISILSKVSSDVPKSGGLANLFTGDNDISTFAMKLPTVGAGLALFAKSLGEFGEDKLQSSKFAGEAIVALSKAAENVPQTKGLWERIFGDNSLTSFSNQLPSLAYGVSTFIEKCSVDESKLPMVETVCKIIGLLADAAKGLPQQDGLWQKIFGENSLATFADNLPPLAEKLNSFIEKIGTFDDAKISTVSAACEAIRTIAGLGNIDMENTGSKLLTFGSNIVDFAKKLKEFVDKLGKVSLDNITSSIDKIKELISMSSTVADANVESLKTFGESLKSFATEGVNGFVEEFSGKDPKEKAKKAVKEMIESAIDGADEKKKDVKNGFKKVGEEAISGLKDESLKLKTTQVGKDFVLGFVSGIKNNTYLAKDAGSSVGKAALKAAKKAIDSNSPSKEAMKLGNDFDMGFVVGIKSLASKVYDTSYSVAEKARDGLSKAVARVSDIFSNGIDSQPMIRPVLDLSSVESGVGTLNSMFNDGPSLGVMANLKAISSGMNARGQNGVNDDVVSAIDKLSKNLGNIKGDTYNVNGVTYDDGSNITDAVKTLVRAAKIERRV